ncbi:hypothetical protein MMC10_007810 [Thelotrema lepadinum]|nr:hypothetical protein [Thelotrema lepadinum]
MADHSAATGFDSWHFPGNMGETDDWAASSDDAWASANVGPPQQTLPGFALNQPRATLYSEEDLDALWPASTHTKETSAGSKVPTESLKEDGKNDKKNSSTYSSAPYPQYPTRTACPTCGKTFSRKSDMSRHARSHDKQSSALYKCPFPSCRDSLGYTRNDELLDHLRARHGCKDIVDVNADTVT